MKKFASWLLRWAERAYLRMHGWELASRQFAGQPEDYFTPPEGVTEWKHAVYQRCHAVNAQRQVYARATRDGACARSVTAASEAQQEIDLMAKLTASVEEKS